MANYFFIGDGCEVLACDGCERNAKRKLKELEQSGHENLSIYELDPSAIIADNSDECGQWVWQFPAERFVAERDYRLPTICEVLAQREQAYRNAMATRLF